jgi:hypothetical protein
VTNRTALANDAGYGRSDTSFQPLHSVSERQLLELLDERNRVTVNLTPETHKARGTDSVESDFKRARRHSPRFMAIDIGFARSADQAAS